MLNFTFSGRHLTESDLSLVGGEFSTPFGGSKSFEEVKLPSESRNQWFWLTDWKVDMSYPGVDDHGWLYAPSFEVADDGWGMIITPSLFKRSTWVRRRRWIRVRKQRLSLSDTSPQSSSSPTKEPTGAYVVENDNDYITRALALVRGEGSSSPKRRDSSASIRGLTAELEVYEEAIQILLQGMKSNF
jgi:hypothetical protein